MRDPTLSLPPPPPGRSERVSPPLSPPMAARRLLPVGSPPTDAGAPPRCDPILSKGPMKGPSQGESEAYLITCKNRACMSCCRVSLDSVAAPGCRISAVELRTRWRPSPVNERHHGDRRMSSPRAKNFISGSRVELCSSAEVSRSAMECTRRAPRAHRGAVGKYRCHASTADRRGRCRNRGEPVAPAQNARGTTCSAVDDARGRRARRQVHRPG